jgi:hypothetical protein
VINSSENQTRCAKHAVEGGPWSCPDCAAARIAAREAGNSPKEQDRKADVCWSCNGTQVQPHEPSGEEPCPFCMPIASDMSDWSVPPKPYADVVAERDAARVEVEKLNIALSCEMLRAEHAVLDAREGIERVHRERNAEVEKLTREREDGASECQAMLATAVNDRDAALAEVEKLRAETERALETEARDKELSRWQARFTEAVIDGDCMRATLHDLAFAAPTVGDEHRNANGWLSPEAWGAYVSRVQKLARGAIRRPACVCVACGCPADAHKVDDEERRECEQCDGCTQYESPR